MSATTTPLPLGGAPQAGGLLWSDPATDQTVVLPPRREPPPDDDQSLRLGTVTGERSASKIAMTMPTQGRVGRYELKLRLGSGGHGTVWAAEDTLLKRMVAVKILPLAQRADGSARVTELFVEEARAAAKLSHPDIVTVFDAGIAPDGGYIVMELLRGDDLSQVLKARVRPPPAAAAVIMQRVAAAVDYAHGTGVIHRDIKPANIFMVEETRPVVLDLGIAQSILDSGPAPGQSPASGPAVSGADRTLGSGGRGTSQSFMCSPYYAAPEQLTGETSDRRTDVYSLGVVFYELLTGQRPYTGSTIQDIAKAQKIGKPRHVTELNPQVPQILAEIAMRAMSTESAGRFRSAGEMSRALEAWIAAQRDNETAHPAPAPAAPDRSSAASTWQWLCAGLALALLGLLAARWL
ncbi:MAG: serine/threonine-protein kinase [Leptothrix sp. (in: b-proteobacteria)]